MDLACAGDAVIEHGMALTVDAGRITAIDVIRDPDKLTGVPGFGDDQQE